MGYLKMVQQDLSAITAPCELPGKRRNDFNRQLHLLDFGKKSTLAL